MWTKQIFTPTQIGWVRVRQHYTILCNHALTKNSQTATAPNDHNRNGQPWQRTMAREDSTTRHSRRHDSSQNSKFQAPSQPKRTHTFYCKPDLWNQRNYDNFIRQQKWRKMLSSLSRTATCTGHWRKSEQVGKTKVCPKGSDMRITLATIRWPLLFASRSPFGWQSHNS